MIQGNGSTHSNGAAPLALVTGASSGIGLETARLLAARGYRTLLLGRRLDRLQDLAAELDGLARATPVAIDLGQPQAIEKIVPDLLTVHGPVQVLINNAGYGQYTRFLDEPIQEHRQRFEVNYFATVAMIHAVLPGMVQQRRGHVINVASMSAKLGAWGHSGYAASKAAVACLTQSLAAEHTHDGVYFSFVSPGIVDTPFFDAPCFAPVTKKFGKRAISASRVARAIVGLLDRPRLEVHVPRYYRLLDWVRAAAPELAHRMVCKNSRPDGE